MRSAGGSMTQCARAGTLSDPTTAASMHFAKRACYLKGVQSKVSYTNLNRFYKVLERGLSWPWRLALQIINSGTAV